MVPQHRCSLVAVVCQERFTVLLTPHSPDMDECEHTQMCPNGDCINMDGSYKCVCKTGYKQSPNQQICIGESTVYLSQIKLLFITLIFHSRFDCKRKRNILFITEVCKSEIFPTPMLIQTVGM